MKPLFLDSPGSWDSRRTLTTPTQYASAVERHEVPLFTLAEKLMVGVAIVFAVLACLGALA